MNNLIQKTSTVILRQVYKWNANWYCVDIALRLDATALRLEAIAITIRLEAIAVGLEAIAIRFGGLALSLQGILVLD